MACFGRFVPDRREGTNPSTDTLVGAVLLFSPRTRATILYALCARDSSLPSAGANVSSTEEFRLKHRKNGTKEMALA